MRCSATPGEQTLDPGRKPTRRCGPSSCCSLGGREYGPNLLDALRDSFHLHVRVCKSGSRDRGERHSRAQALTTHQLGRVSLLVPLSTIGRHLLRSPRSVTTLLFGQLFHRPKAQSSSVPQKKCTTDNPGSAIFRLVAASHGSRRQTQIDFLPVFPPRYFQIRWWRERKSDENG